jgi:large subunit ribosomal protein L2
MAIKKFSPTTPSRRFMTVVSREDITKRRRKSRWSSRPEEGGRNNTGRVTSRFIAGGHKQAIA